jgi:hypothetical protein
MKPFRVVTAIAFLLAAMAGQSPLVAQTLTAFLSGEQEVPGVATNASGRIEVKVDRDRMTYTLTASGFGTQVTAAHFHLGGKGVSGPVILFLYNSKTQGPFTGTVTGTILPSDLLPNKDRGISTFEDARQAILAGRVYANMHTDLNPAGEIRGQIPPLTNAQP